MMAPQTSLPVMEVPVTNSQKLLKWERRPQERPLELLKAALEVFARNGYRNTTLEEIGEAAGVTKGAIYHYFANKESLLLAVIEHYQALAFTRAEQGIRNRRIPASTRIRLLIRRVFSDTEGRRDLLALLVRGVTQEIPSVHERWMRGPVHLWTLVAKLVEEGKARGEFRLDADGDVGARVLVSGLMLQLMWQLHADTMPAIAMDADRLIDSSVELFLGSLRLPSGRGSKRE
jgi:AcrR family transcriptional regulator